MCKTFFVAPGHEAVNRGVWHRSGLLVSVEEGESLEIYALDGAAPTIRVGAWLYGDLDPASPPVGLLRDHRYDVPAAMWRLVSEAATA
jgi:hypothetical protein